MKLEMYPYELTTKSLLLPGLQPWYTFKNRKRV